MNKEIIEEYQRMKKERDALYVRTLNLNIGSGLRMLKDELYVKEANLKKYMWLHNLTDDFTLGAVQFHNRRLSANRTILLIARLENQDGFESPDLKFTSPNLAS
jgi:hypothetical protein